MFSLACACNAPTANVSLKVACFVANHSHWIVAKGSGLGVAVAPRVCGRVVRRNNHGFAPQRCQLLGCMLAGIASRNVFLLAGGGGWVAGFLARLLAVLLACLLAGFIAGPLASWLASLRGLGCGHSEVGEFNQYVSASR